MESSLGRTGGLGVSPTLEIPFRYGILLDSTYHGRANVWGTSRGFGNKAERLTHFRY
jgi:hypothetical protein